MVEDKNEGESGRRRRLHARHFSRRLNIFPRHKHDWSEFAYVLNRMTSAAYVRHIRPSKCSMTWIVFVSWPHAYDQHQ